MFSTQAEFICKILSGGAKQCTLRWPTDAEWCERTRKQKTIRRQLGRGQTAVEAPGSQRSNLDLFEKIRIDKDGPAFDEHDASKALEKLERCEVQSVSRSGDQYSIRATVTGKRIEVEHVLRMPTEKDVFEYGGAAVHRRDGRRESITTVALEPGGVLYNKLFVSATGYRTNGDAVTASDIPIIHKDVAIVEVLTQMQLDEDDEDPE